MSAWRDRVAPPPVFARALGYSGQMARRAAGLLQRTAGHDRELARQSIGHLAADRQLALALELLDGGLRLGTENAGRLDLAVAVIGQRALYGEHALGRRDGLRR